MRFLFVYQDFAQLARDLVRELLVADVQIIVTRKGQLAPTERELAQLIEHIGADAAACQVDRKYRRNVEQYVKFTIEPKKFRFEDQLLREWLVPRLELGAEIEVPSVPFGAAERRADRLILHSEALKFADDLDGSRWRFASAAADLLAQCALGIDLGPMREWESLHGVAFASNGQVGHNYEFEMNGRRNSSYSEWHLKAGDKTTPDRAARIYFSVVDVGPFKLVLVARVGPHPTDGIYTVDFGQVGL